MTAIQTMRNELDKLISAMSQCVTEEGHVRSECRYKYQMLVRQAQAFQKSIEWMEEQVYVKT